MSKLGHILAILSVAVLAACSKDSVWTPAERPNPAHREGTPDNGFDNVLVLYCAAYNNLQSDIERNLSQLSEGYVPTLHSKNAIVVFSHKSATDYDHTTPTDPVIYRIYDNGAFVVRDTLKTYPSDVCSASPATVKDAMMFIRDKFPSTHYGFLISSHGTGWIPPEYDPGSESKSAATTGISPNSVGVQQGEYRNVWLGTEELCDAIPFHVDYIIFDACLMSCIEVVYTFRDKCDYIVASPTEVLTSGFIYNTMTSHLFYGEEPDLEAFCSEYVSKRSSATIALMDCSKAADVADACRTIFSTRASGVLDLRADLIQDYNNSYAYNYDLRDLCRVMGADAGELAALDSALEKCVIYKGATGSFLGHPIDPKRYSGLSVYLPRRNFPILNSLYKETSWNKATGLLK